MKKLLEKYIKCSNAYVDSYSNPPGVSINPAKDVDDAGKTLRKAAKEKGFNLKELNDYLIKFISSNVHRKTDVKSVAKHYEERNKIDIQNLKDFLGVK